MLALRASTNNVAIDQILQEVVGTFEAAFPGHIWGYYLLGSYTDDSKVATSDIDLDIVFRGDLGEVERQRAVDLGRACAEVCPVELDIDLKAETTLREGTSPLLKLASLLVYGEDICARLPLVSLEDWTRDRMHTSYWRIVKLFKRPEVVTYPLAYPDPDAEFYGYDCRTVRLEDGTEVNSTRDLIRSVGWAATALVACEAGRYVVRKRDCHRIYKECFQDEGGELLMDIYEQCRGCWKYLIPERREDRRQLRAICARTLAFENRFLRSYKRFLIAELRSSNDEARRQAQAIVKQIPYKDQEVLSMLDL